jgi:hypothetical protein
MASDERALLFHKTLMGNVTVQGQADAIMTMVYDVPGDLEAFTVTEADASHQGAREGQQTVMLKAEAGFGEITNHQIPL